MNAAPPTSQRPSSLLEGYAPPPGVYDETVSATGEIRPAWKTFLSGLEALGPGELERRWKQAQRQVTRDGVTFNPYDIDGEASRPWVLDAVPLLIHEQEWRAVERGLDQRARLFDLILRDLYGPQQLLRNGLLPPAALFGHPAYYPAYHGLQAGDKRSLHLYSADLGRSPEGTWWVINDRSRAPFGLGYVLENRIVTSRMLPRAFRKCGIKRLAAFFIDLKETLRQQATRFKDNPRVALWTKGPASRAYFEDAYLARYLGYTLVEGGDLAVRENRVMLKTLGGLLPVEVLFRRLDDEDCDPVELDDGSTLGVAGLLEVIRSGNVSVANIPGSRLIESPLLMAFLPSLCEHFFGESLSMPSIATWWCGETDERKYVLDHLDELIIRRAHRLEDEQPIRPALLSKAEKANLVSRLKARPEEYVGQETVHRSTTPVWTEQGVQPWSLAVRAFLVNREDHYVALPGGLARVSPEPMVLESTMTSGERSRDVWIVSETPVEHVSLLSPPGETAELRRSGAELPSRVADQLFWVGRYVERAEGSARLLRTVFSLVSGESGRGHELQPLLRALAEQGLMEPDYAVPELAETLQAIEEALPKAVFDMQLPRSLKSTIGQVVRLVSMVRDRVSVDAWRIIQRIDESARSPIADVPDVLEFLDRIITDLVAVSGLVAESMTRTQGWRLLDLGRRVERAWHTSLLLRSTLTTVTPEEQSVLEAVLLTADSIMTYRSRYLATVQPEPVLDLLLTDETNPRSIGYQMEKIADHVDRLPRDQTQAVLSQEQRLALSLRNAVRLADVYELCENDSDGFREQMERLLKRLIDQLPKLSDAVSSRFLIHAGLPRHFGTSERSAAT